MKLSLSEIDFDVIERTAEKRGMPAFQLLRAIADNVETAPKSEEAAAPPPPPKPRELSEYFSEAVEYVRGLPIGTQITAFEVAYAVIGGVPTGRGTRRMVTAFVRALPGLSPVPDQNSPKHTARRETRWGASNLYQRIPLVTSRGEVY